MKTHFIALLTILSLMLHIQGQNQRKTITQSIAFAAILKDKAEAQKAIKDIGKLQKALSDSGIRNLQFFTQSINKQDIILATMDIDQPMYAVTPTHFWNITRKADLFKNDFIKLEKSILPHPRHTKPNDSPWVQTETICKLRPNNAADAKQDNPWYSAVTGLKKDKEAEYRLLHNNVWPGVIHAIGASNINRFDIFLIEFGDNQPYLFYLFQYTGTDFANDMKSQSKSPVNQRWWKFTDACQAPLPEAKHGPWLDMNPL